MGKKTFKFDKVLCRHFGRKVLQLRNKSNLTQDDVAFSVGISASYLSAIERGSTDLTISTAKRIAKVFNIDLPELFTFK